MTNEEMLQKMAEDMKLRNFSHYSYDTYLSKAKEMVRYFNKPMEEVTTDEMRKFLMMLKDERHLANKTVNYYNSILRFMYEVTLDIVLNKKQIPMLKHTREICKVLTKEELSAFFNACEDIKYKTIFMLIYGSGLRIGETANLRVEDIDSKRMRIFVRDGKGNKQRYTILPKASLEMLREYYKKERPEHPEGYMFLNSEGNPLKVERMRVYFRRYRRKAKLNDKFVVHSLRHSFATNLIERGATLLQVKELLGHRNIRSTMEYVHVANIDLGLESPLDEFLKEERMEERKNDKDARNI